MKTKGTGKKLGLNFLFLIIGVVMFTPIYFLLVTTFKSPAEAAASPLGFPQNLTLDYYKVALDAMNFFQALKNNLIIVVFAVIFLVIFSSMAAYAIVRGSSVISKIMFSVFMVGLIIPFQVTMIPMYRIVLALGMMNTLWGVIIIDVFCINMSLSIFLFKGFINT
ncbi:MAG: carbohydrate ABC transporter permease, partial [Oscillospiraceae bacterium]|nr:carbohydrate ABC transporter permease [Oscillospiraceae bacterium]